MSAMLRLPWQRPLHSNGAVNILQLWASADRTREPISVKFGTCQVHEFARVWELRYGLLTSLTVHMHEPWSGQ